MVVYPVQRDDGRLVGGGRQNRTRPLSPQIGAVTYQYGTSPSDIHALLARHSCLVSRPTSCHDPWRLAIRR